MSDYVTDPELLKQLSGSPTTIPKKGEYVSDPALLEQLNKPSKSLTDRLSEQYEKEVKQFKEAPLRATTDIVNRGIVASTIGLPVDLVNLGLKGIDYATGTQLASENPFLGSEYIGGKMEDVGIVSPNRYPIFEAVAGLAPGGVAGVGKGVAKTAQAVRQIPAVPARIAEMAQEGAGFVKNVVEGATKTVERPVVAKVGGIPQPRNAPSTNLGRPPTQEELANLANQTRAPAEVFVVPGQEKALGIKPGQKTITLPGEAGTVVGQNLRKGANLTPTNIAVDILTGAPVFTGAQAANQVRKAIPPVLESVRGTQAAKARTLTRGVDELSPPRTEVPVGPSTNDRFYLTEEGVPRLEIRGTNTSEVTPVTPTTPQPAVVNPVEQTLEKIKNTVGTNLDEAGINNVYVSTRGKEIINEAKKSGVVLNRKQAEEIANKEITAHREQLRNKAVEEQRVLKEKQQKDFEASPEGQAFAQNKKQIDDLIAQDRDFATRMRDETTYNNAINNPAYRQSIIDDIAAKKAEQEANVLRQQQYKEEIAKRNQEKQAEFERQRKERMATLETSVEPTVIPKTETLNPAPPAISPANPKDILAEIRARGKTPEVTKTPEVAKVETPAIPENMPPQPPKAATTNKPAGLAALQEKLRNTPPPTPEEIAAQERLFQQRENRSLAQKAAQPERRSREVATKTMSQTVVSGTKTPKINYDEIVSQAKDTGLKLDWSTFPDVKNMSLKDTRKAIKKWADESTRRYDPKNPYPERPNNFTQLFD